MTSNATLFIESAVCAACRNRFRRRVAESTEPAAICGQLWCRAVTHWSPDEWAGRVRMANARAAAGVMLDRLDLEALRRAEEAA